MAKAYTLIQAQTLTSSAASVTFSNIPQNYTDLIVKISGRATAGSGTSRAIQLQINGDTTYSNYRQRYIRTDDTGAAQSGAFLSSTGLKYYFYGLPNANVTANSFGAAELTFINYAGSSYKTFSAEAFAEGFHNPFTGTAGNSITAALWVNTAAITTLVFNPDDSSSFAAGSTFYLYGVGGARATGGTITYDANYTYHAFTSTSTFTPLEKIKNAEVLVIAGGGASTGTVLNGYATPGGGAGGLVYSSGQTLFAGTSYTAIVGAGGAAGASGNTTRGGNGGNSQFGSVTLAVGGGGGGAQPESPSIRAGSSGGSGGGSFLAAGGAATAGQGNAGGNAASDHPYLTSGGGGAAEVGGIGAGDYISGKGGDGSSSYSQWGLTTGTGQLSGNSYYYAGGGAGGLMLVTSSRASAGGLGGGGSNTSSANGKTNGTANTGGGASGVNGYGAATAGASGGSGLVIVRYPST